jgi:rod shape-determining protein MreD
VLVLAAVLVTALLLQSTLFPQISLLGIRPELLYLVTILVAVLEGPTQGAVVGFSGGLLQDFLLNEPKGITALTLTLLGYAMGLVRQYLTSPSPLLPTILVAVGTAAGITFHLIVSFLLGQFDQPIAYAAKVVLLTSVYNAVLTPIVYPLLRRLLEGSRPRKVVRF